MSQHARLSASAAHRWMNCPASVSLSQLVPARESGDAAKRGTDLHEKAQQYQLGLEPDLTNDEWEIVGSYIQMIDDLSFDDWVTEMGLLQPLKTIDRDLGGTADFVTWNRDTIRVIDFKTGRQEVNPQDNYQLMLYALGAWIELGKVHKRVEMYICQPTVGLTLDSYGPDKVPVPVMTAEELAAFIDRAAIAAEMTRRVSDPVAGDHCKFCPAVTICPKHTEAVGQVAVLEAGGPIVHPSQLGQAMRMIELFDRWAKDVKKQVYKRLLAGEKVEGYKLVEKRGRRVFTDETEAAKMLEEWAVEPYERKLRSPAQVEKNLTKEQKKALREIVVTHSSGVTLAPESDRRPAVNNNSVLTIDDEFDNIGDSDE